MKRIGIAIAVLALVAVVAVVWYLASNLDAIVERTIEDAGTEVLGVPVEVGSVDVRLREESATVRDLRVANPPGFGPEGVFQLGEIRVRLDAASLAGDGPVVLPEVRVVSPRVRFEVNATGRANVGVLRENLERSGSDEPAGGGAGAGAEAEPVRLRVDRFTFEDGTLVADATAAGGESRELAMPALDLRALGGARGATPEALARRVLDAFLARAAAAAARSQLQGYLEEKIDESMGEAGEAAKGVLRGILGDSKREE